MNIKITAAGLALVFAAAALAISIVTHYQCVSDVENLREIYSDLSLVKLESHQNHLDIAILRSKLERAMGE